VAGETPGRAFAATWRNEQGETVATSWGGTMCWAPRKPWRIRIARDGFEHVIRCGECPGCLEFDRRRLAERLHAKYSSLVPGRRKCPGKLPAHTAQPAGGAPIQLFVIRIYAPAESHAAMSHSLHRRPSLDLEPGFARLGASSFALLARGIGPLRRVLAKTGVRFRIEPLKLNRGRRAWRALTAGLIVAREVYGEQVNRFYFRGLPAADREKWEVRKIGKYQSYNRASSPRAWTGSRLVLVPPEVWQLSRVDRRSLRGLLGRAADPEGVRRVMGIVADTIRAAGARIPVSAAAEGRLTKEQVAEWYRKNAERAAARTASPSPDQIITPVLGTGGYVSSEHSQGELMPEQLAEADRKEWREGRKAKALRESLEIIERMRLKSTGGK